MITRVFGCDKCGHRWELFQARDAKPPRGCPSCRKIKRARKPIPSTTAIGKRLSSKSVDSVYRAMEEGAAFRAEKSGNSALKITDMKSGVRAGEVVAKKVVNDVSRYAENNGGFWNGSAKQMAAGGLTTQQLVQQAKASEGYKAIDAVRTRHGGQVLPQVPAATVRAGVPRGRRAR